MTLACATFQVRDLDLPDRPALAAANDLGTAVDRVQRLHEQFRDQLAANSEGAGGRISQRLVVLEQRPDGEPGSLLLVEHQRASAPSVLPARALSRP